MAKRVILGKISTGVYGLRISRKGVDVTTASGKDLLFDSTTNSGLGRYFRKFSSATASSGFNNFIPTSGAQQILKMFQEMNITLYFYTYKMEWE